MSFRGLLQGQLLTILILFSYLRLGLTVVSALQIRLPKLCTHSSSMRATSPFHLFLFHLIILALTKSTSYEAPLDAACTVCCYFICLQSNHSPERLRISSRYLNSDREL
jgi:hypothetical protein